MRKEIMKKAWQISRRAAVIWGGTPKQYIAEALKMAWAESRTDSNETRIEKLEKLGFKRWTKNGMDRMYINATRLGLEVQYYRTGNVKHAEWHGEETSNGRARALLAAKTYIDLADWSVHSNEPMLLNAAAELLATA